MRTNSEKLTVPEAGAPWSVLAAARHLGISDKHLRRLVDAGAVRVIRFGRRVFVPDAELRRLAEDGAGQPANSAGNEVRDGD